MKIPNSLICLLLLIGLFSTSCQTVLDVELPERNPKIVVNCLFEQDSNFYFEISTSKEILDTASFKHLDDVTILLSSSDGRSETISTSEITLIGYEEKRVYKSLMRAEAGNSYNITVNHPDFDPVNSVAEIGEGVKINSIDTSMALDFGQEVLRLNVSFNDPIGVNYYEFKVFKYGRIIKYNPPFFEPDTAIGFEEVFYYFPSDAIFSSDDGSTFTDELFEGKRHEFTVNISTFFLDNLGDTDEDSNSINSYLLPELRTITESYYQYRSTLSKFQLSKNDPFSQPVQVYNNIDGGFGVFAGFSKSSDTLFFNP